MKHQIKPNTIEYWKVRYYQQLAFAKEFQPKTFYCLQAAQAKSMYLNGEADFGITACRLSPSDKVHSKEFMRKINYKQ